MGCYQEGIAKDTVNGKAVTAHIFEYTTSVLCTPTGETAMHSCPVQVIFCLKEQNKKKLNSHRWFFNAFGPLIKPEGWLTVHFASDVNDHNLQTSLRSTRCWDQTDEHIDLRIVEVYVVSFS